MYKHSHSLVMPSMEIEEAPPALRGAVQHREDPHKRSELAGGRRAPLLHHQMRNVPRLSRQLTAVLSHPVSRREKSTTPFKRRAVESQGDDHQEPRHHQQGVGCAVSQQEPPIQLHVLRQILVKLLKKRMFFKSPLGLFLKHAVV